MHPLEAILQVQLGSDQAAVLSLPSILSAISPAHFEASPHLQKWISRATSLIHSKHPGARWAGLCLALQTSTLNKGLMMESAQSWIGIALPMLSRNEVPPTWKACIRLLDYIFASAVGTPEFQRQVATPNVPKFSSALVSLAEKTDDPGVRRVAMASLTHLIPLYPTLHRTLHPSLSSLSLNALSGSPAHPTPSIVIEDACHLHAVLHFIGGKVGAAPLWRKSLDTALANAWFAFAGLRTTFPPVHQPTLGAQPTLEGIPTDPVVAVSLSLDRLKCAIHLIEKLLTAVTLRPVRVPIGELVKLALRLLRCAPDEAEESHPDAVRRALEISVIPDILQLGCKLVAQLGKSVRHYLDPQLSRIISHITYHLEQQMPTSRYIPFLRVLPPLLEHTHALHSSILSTRLVKTLFPILTVLLTSKSEAQQQLQDSLATTSKKGKKRARAYEGDEVFHVGRSVLCPTPEDGEAVVSALDALDVLLSNPYLDATVRTIVARLLVTLVLELPRYPPATLSPDPTLHGRMYARVLWLCNTHVLAGTSGWVNSAVGLVVNAVGEARDGSETVMRVAGEAQRTLEVLLHPRLPPLLRAQPPLEAIGLFRSENAKGDKLIQEELGLGVMEGTQATGEGVTAITKTTTVEDGTEATTSVAAAVVSQPQSWSTTNVAAAVVPQPQPPEARAAPLVSVSTVTAPENASKSPVMTQTPEPSTIAVEAAPPKMPAVRERKQEEARDPSTSSQVFRATQYESSDEDEEMPVIHMSSDSE